MKKLKSELRKTFEELSERYDLAMVQEIMFSQIMIATISRMWVHKHFLIYVQVLILGGVIAFNLARLYNIWKEILETDYSEEEVDEKRKKSWQMQDWLWGVIVSVFKLAVIIITGWFQIELLF